MAVQPYICNLCNKPIEKHTEDTFSDHRRCGYGSQHDGLKRDIDLCANCYDQELNNLNERCEIPIIGNDAGYEDCKYGD